MSVPAGAALVAYYPLDEAAGDGGPAADVVGGNDGVPIGAAAPVRGVASPRAAFGTATEFPLRGGLDLGTTTAVRPVDRFTITWWMRPDTLNAFDRLYESLAGTGNDGEGMRIDLGGAGTAIRVLLRDGNGVSNTQHTHSTLFLDDGTWYFFAVRYDSSTGDGSALRMTVLEAGEGDVTADDIAAGTESPGALGTGPINVHAAGAYLASDDDNSSGSNDFGGALDEVAFFDDSDGDGVLSDEQLAAVYNGGPRAIVILDEFTADPPSGAPGAAVTLSWEVGEFDTLVLDNDVGDVAPQTAAGAGSIEVFPAATTTYALTATRGGISHSLTATVIVGEAPVIDSFSITGRAEIVEGDSTTLSWSTTGAETVTLEPGVGAVEAAGETSVSPAATTTYTLTASNAFGSSVAEATVAVTDVPPAANFFDAATEGNDEATWSDEIGTNNWALTEVERVTELVTPATTLTAAYRLVGEGLARGGGAGGFPVGDRTVEVWVRPGDLDAGHQVIFENGGGQNGSAILMTESDIRYIGSEGNVRNVDLTLPLSGLVLDDFIQITYVVGDDADTVDLYVRDTAGTVLHVMGEGGVSRGGNLAGIFVWASGALGASHNNLGGRTELPDASPEGLTNFRGEIARVIFYDDALTAEQVEKAFRRVVIPDPGLIDAFEAAPVRVPAGGTATFSWTVQPFTTLEIQPGVGDVSGDTVGGAGSREFAPGASGFFTLVATNEGGISRARTFVLVDVPEEAVYLAVDSGDGEGWDNPGAWSDGAAPAPGVDYIVAGVPAAVLGTPATEAPVFGGRSLELRGGDSVLVLRHQGDSTARVDDLRLGGGAQVRQSGADTPLGLAGRVAVTGPALIELSSTGQSLDLAAAIGGAGEVRLLLGDDPTSANVVSLGSSENALDGLWHVTGGQLIAVAPQSLGGAGLHLFNATFAAGYDIDLPGRTLTIEGEQTVVQLDRAHRFGAFDVVDVNGGRISVVPGLLAEGSYDAATLNGALGFSWFAGDQPITFDSGGGGEEDTDQNGLGDAWEIAFFGAIGQDPAGDPDGDGQDNRAEFIAGTAPDDARDAFVVSGVVGDPAAGTFSLSWSSAPGKRYQVQFRARFDDPWVTLAEVPAAAGEAATSFEDGGALSGASGFYRVVVIP